MNISPTPKRYTSRSDFRNERPPQYGNNLRFNQGYPIDNRNNINPNPRERLIPKEYQESAKTVDDLLYEVKSLNRKLYEQQLEENRLIKLSETLKGKLSKYHQIALKYRQERNDLSFKLYNRNIFDNNDIQDDNMDIFNENNVNRGRNDDMDENDQIYIGKRRNDNVKNIQPSVAINNPATQNKTKSNDSELKEKIDKLYQMVSNLQLDSVSNGNENHNLSNLKGRHDDNSKYPSERDLDIIKTEELKQLEDAVLEYREKLEAKKAYEKRKISAQQEISQIQKELNEFNYSHESRNTSRGPSNPDIDRDYEFSGKRPSRTRDGSKRRERVYTFNDEEEKSIFLSDAKA